MAKIGTPVKKWEVEEKKMVYVHGKPVRDAVGQMFVELWPEYPELFPAARFWHWRQPVPGEEIVGEVYVPRRFLEAATSGQLVYKNGEPFSLQCPPGREEEAAAVAWVNERDVLMEIGSRR